MITLSLFSPFFLLTFPPPGAFLPVRHPTLIDLPFKSPPSDPPPTSLVARPRGALGRASPSALARCDCRYNRRGRLPSFSTFNFSLFGHPPVGKSSSHPAICHEFATGTHLSLVSLENRKIPPRTLRLNAALIASLQHRRRGLCTGHLHQRVYDVRRRPRVHSSATAVDHRP